MQINYSSFVSPQSAVRSPQTSLSFCKTQFSLTSFFLITFLLLGFVSFSKTTPIPKEISNNVQQGWKVTGKISGAGDPLIGVNIIEKGTTNGTTSDFDGNFSITVTDKKAVLVVSYIGFVTKEIKIDGKSTFDIILEEDNSKLDEVVVVSFGTQKKASVVSSITTVKPSDLKIPSSNLTTALAGRVAGLISYQRSGEPGADNAEFFIRGITSFGRGGNGPLILVDGIESGIGDLSRLNPDDIASFSIFKDASATALYGARGANGVVYITTKEGVEGPVQVSIRTEVSSSSSRKNIEIADPVTYMRLYNEAVRTRDPLEPVPFSLEKIDNTISGINPLLYPQVDWQKQLFKDYAINSRVNLSLKGGGKVARYYVSGSYSQDNGILEVPKISNFNSNINFRKAQLRSNVNLNLTPTSKLKLSFNAAFDDYTGPRESGSDIYRRALSASPVLYHPFYEKDAANEFTDHILFGNAIERATGNTDTFYENPYAFLVAGYRESTSSNISAKIEVKQDFTFIAEGLSAKAIINYNRKSNYSISRSYRPFWYEAIKHPLTDAIILESLNPDDGRETLGFSSNGSNVESSDYLELDINYTRNIDETHDITGLLVLTQNNRVFSVRNNDLQGSLPFRNRGLAGRFTYGYDNRYFAEFNFGYNGSERFSKKERWGFFPSIAVGWVVSNEKFLEDNKVLNNLKLKATYGLVGNDQIGNPRDRFFYISNVNLTDAGRGFRTGEDYDNFVNGVSTSRYANDNITWETGRKLNVGMELGLFNSISLEADFFTETRVNILFDRIIPASLGLQAPVRANVGEVKSKGIDGTLVYTKDLTDDFWIQAKGNFTYATNKITKIEEPDYSATPWRSRIGQSVRQAFGYVAERLFVDQAEVNNSPKQLGEYSGGDIKYKDIDGNGVIDGLDQVPIGNPFTPEIVYGMGFSLGYKNFDFSTFLQGSANSSFYINPISTAPFIGRRQLLQVWADSHWSEQNRDINAKWPRLSEQVVRNNLQSSTWFLRNGSFLRIKNIEIGYSLPESLLSKINFLKFRIYATGTNIFTFSRFKLWDPELAGNATNYPIQLILNIGLNISL